MIVATHIYEGRKEGTIQRDNKKRKEVRIGHFRAILKFKKTNCHFIVIVATHIYEGRKEQSRGTIRKGKG